MGGFLMHKKIKMTQSLYRNDYVSQNEYDALRKGEAQLEQMYPPVYYIVYPEVVKQCNTWDRTYGPTQTPTKEQLDDMVETIHNNVQPKLNRAPIQESEKAQYRGGFFGDIISIVLLGELIGRRRRRRRYYGYPRRRPYGRF